MKPYKAFALALSLGILYSIPSSAATHGERKTETVKTQTPGTQNGVEGTWVKTTVKIYQYNDPKYLAFVDAYQSVFGRTPIQAEIQNYLQQIADGTTSAQIRARLLATKPLEDAGLSQLDAALANDIRAKVLAGGLSSEAALPQVKALVKLANENKNSKYPNTLSQAFLGSTGAISAAVALQVGAFGGGIGVDTKIRSAYQALGIDPSTKKMPNGQTLSGDFNTMISQLKTANLVTYDWNFATLMNDLGRQNLVDMANARNGVSVSGAWGGNQQNLFSKDNLNDPTLQHDWQAGINGAYVDDATVRSWISTYDGIGSFNNRGDVDLYMAVTYSSAAKLVAESKALAAMGMKAQADAKIVAARNIVLLTGNNHDPLVLDINHNGKVDVTGLSSAKHRNEANKRFVKDGSVNFDLLANGKPLQIEWIKGGDGFLIDNRKNAALEAVKVGKNLTGANLFGDIDGYPGGFLKLGMNFDKEAKYAANEAVRLSPEFAALKGDELDSLMVWVDNGDGIATRNELKTLNELGITEINVRPEYKKENGELLEQAYFVQNGKKHLIQEVWFRSSN